MECKTNVKEIEFFRHGRNWRTATFEKGFFFLKNGYILCFVGPCFNFSTNDTCKNIVGFSDGFL